MIVPKPDITGCAITLLGNPDLTETLLGCLVVVLRPVDEHHYIRVLFYRPGLPKVG